MAIFEKTSAMPCDAESLYAWHARPGAFERLAPPWRQVRLLEGGASIEAGSEARIATRLGPVPIHWNALIESNEPGRSFVDRQTRGPFQRWRHSHIFEEVGEAGSKLVDRVEYRLRGGKIGEWLGGAFARRELERMFAYRHALTARELAVWARYRDRERWRVLLVGGSGFIGSRLKSYLQTQGNDVSILSRRPGPGRIEWDPQKKKVARESLEEFDVVINLAGKNLADGRWSETLKKELWSSRVDSSRFLVETLLALKNPPKLYASASGVGIYGDCGDREADEESVPGSGFLAELCQAWESEANKASSFADRVLLLRTGVVVDAAEGALQKMKLPFIWGMGGPMGNGRQWMPWIGLEDWLGGLYFALQEGLSGPLNLVAPNPSRNKEFAGALGRVLSRPSWAPAPEWALTLALGEFAREALLSSCRARPTRLLDSGYEFGFSDIESYLRFTLGR